MRHKITTVVIAILIIISIFMPISVVNGASEDIIGIPDVHVPNPLLIENPTDYWLSSLIWQPLTWYENGQVYPVIAESWMASGTTWKFKIRNNIFWENGTPLTPNDVVDTYNYLLHMKLNKRIGGTIWLLISNIRDVKTATDGSVVFHLFKPDPHFAEDVTSNVFILPPYMRKDNQQSGGSLWGSGMYYLSSYQKDKLIFKKNPRYSGNIPYADTLIFTNSPSAPNRIVYPSEYGTQQYNIAIRLVFNTEKKPFQTWPYRYLLIATAPYTDLAQTGTAGTPCLIYSPMCHSSLHIDRLVFDTNEFINNYSIDLQQLKNLTLYTPAYLSSVAETLTQRWKDIGIGVSIKTLPLKDILFNPPDGNMFLIPIGGSTSPYTLASPDYPLCRWNYPNFFIKLSEGITGDRSKLITALEILDYTYPSTTILFPKIEIIISSPHLKKHTAGLGIPMLTSPIDDVSLIMHTPSEESTSTTETSTIAETSHLKTYFIIGLSAVAGVALLILLFIFLKTYGKRIWKKVIHFPTLLVFGGLISKLKRKRPQETENEGQPKESQEETTASTSEAENQETQEVQETEKEESPLENKEKETTDNKKKFAIPWKSIKLRWSIPIPKIKSNLSKVKKKLSTWFSSLAHMIKISLSKLHSNKPHPTDEMFRKATETIISHIEKGGTTSEVKEDNYVSSQDSQESGESDDTITINVNNGQISKTTADNENTPLHTSVSGNEDKAEPVITSQQVDESENAVAPTDNANPDSEEAPSTTPGESTIHEETSENNTEQQANIENPTPLETDTQLASVEGTNQIENPIDVSPTDTNHEPENPNNVSEEYKEEKEDISEENNTNITQETDTSLETDRSEQDKNAENTGDNQSIEANIRDTAPDNEELSVISKKDTNNNQEQHEMLSPNGYTENMASQDSATEQEETTDKEEIFTDHKAETDSDNPLFPPETEQLKKLIESIEEQQDKRQDQGDKKDTGDETQ